MKLRLRLAVAAAGAMLATALVFSWYDRLEHHRAALTILTHVTALHADRELDACTASPATWGGTLPRRAPPGARPPLPPPPPAGPPPRPSRAMRPAEVYAYDAQFRSENPRAPKLPDSLTRALESADVATSPVGFSGNGVEVLMRRSASGPCAYVFGRGTTNPSWGDVVPPAPFWLVPMTAVLVAVLLAAGPIVRRIRRLESAVAQSVSNFYAEPVRLDGADEISELAGAFDRARREIRGHIDERERRAQALQDFIANTTHDVMLPLTVLQGHLTELREQLRTGKALDAGVLSSAMNEAHYMGSLVHNLAAVAKLDDATQPLERHAVDLNTLVERVVTRHSPLARERVVSLDVAVPADPVLVYADVTLIEQALNNVTFNAIRYNRAGGHVAVILDVTAESFKLRVIDDGPGMTDEERARAIERGARGEEARSRFPDGQGLGLTIASRAATLHDFELRLAPSEYGGLEVSLSGSAACG